MEIPAIEQRKYMEISAIWAVGLCFLLAGHGFEADAYHHGSRNLQSNTTEQVSPIFNLQDCLPLSAPEKLDEWYVFSQTP